MGMIVCKFGGSSVAEARQVQKVAAILRADASRRIVVVSAPGKRDKSDTKITDMLYDCASLVAKGGSCKDVFSRIAERYLGIAAELGMETGSLSSALDEVYHGIERGLGPDYAASRGEYLSARMVSDYLGWEFLDTAELIHINDDGTVAESTYTGMDGRFEEGKHYVVPGFYGSTADGRIKTFSRGGSDITGSIVARAAHADLYENWTDVSGVFMADPRIIAEAKVIKTMSYREVRELAAVGFNVFHEEAIAPVREAGIPIQVKNTNKPSDAGTSIVVSRQAAEDPIVGVTAKGGYCRLYVQKLLLFKRQGVRSEMEATLKTLGIVPEFALTGIDSVVWFFPVAQVANGTVSSVTSILKNQFLLEDVTCDSGYAVVALTGEGLYQSKRVAERLWPALQAKSLPVQFLSFGASPVSCLVGIPETSIQEAIQTVYDACIK